jgi:acid stress-induced BolA-like protein IbaG/YrbA
VALLLVGVAGGYYLGDDRQIQKQGIESQFAAQAEVSEQQEIKARVNDHAIQLAQIHAAELVAKQKAAAAAKAAAERARKAEEASRKARADAAKAKAKETVGPAKPYTGPIPESCNEYSGARKTGCALMLSAGFAIDQFPCLDKLFAKESGWSYKASNSSTGAYGIPQALPGSKMSSAGSDWKTNPATQIKWGLSYIKGRYGKPCTAWAHSQDTGWY